MSKPLVSVVIPVYNVEPYLSECLDSVINQTYSNIEIIAINDGSTDNSLNILKEYESKFSNITIISQENSGLSASRNKGIKESNGEYIYFLDSDDYIASETFENLIGLMEERKLELIHFGAEPFTDGIGMKINKHLYDFQDYFETGKVYDKKEWLNSNLKAFSPSVPLYLMRRDLIIKNQLEFKTGIIHEDELFTLLLILNTNTAMYDPHFYYKRRYRDNSIMTTQSIETIKRSFDSYYMIAMDMIKLLETYSNTLEVKLIKKRIRTIYNSLLQKGIDEEYKKKRLSDIGNVNIIWKFYYLLKYKFLKSS